METQIGAFIGTKFSNAKLEFDARQAWILNRDQKVYQAIYGENPSMQINDGNYYAAKSVGSVAAFDDLFKSDDSISVGLGNLAEGAPPANEYFLISKVQLLYAVAGGTANSDVKAANFGVIYNDYIKNGTIEIMQNKRIILPEMSLEPFCKIDQVVATGDDNPAADSAKTYTMKYIGTGIFELNCPKLLVPQEKIEVNLKFAAATGQANAAMKVVLHGVKNVKN